LRGGGFGGGCEHLHQAVECEQRHQRATGRQRQVVDALRQPGAGRADVQAVHQQDRAPPGHGQADADDHQRHQQVDQFAHAGPDMVMQQVEAEVAVGVHAGGGAHAHGRGQQQQGDRLGPAG